MAGDVTPNARSWHRVWTWGHRSPLAVYGQSAVRNIDHICTGEISHKPIPVRELPFLFGSNAALRLIDCGWHSSQRHDSPAVKQLFWP